MNMFCNSIDGYCKCKSGYTGPFCTNCVDDFHHPIQGQRRIPTKCVQLGLESLGLGFLFWRIC